MYWGDQASYVRLTFRFNPGGASYVILRLPSRSVDGNFACGSEVRKSLKSSWALRT